jgi:hypothetical protein
LYRSRGTAWSIPLLVRWRFAGEQNRPFLTGGYTYHRIPGAVREGESFRTGPIVSGEEVDYTVHRYTQQSPGENTHGVTAGGGIEFRIGRFRVAPEARYTRWNRRYWEEYGSRGFFTGSNRNQVDVLFGISF